MCLPKLEGGLGSQRVSDMAKVFALKLIWRLHSKSDSLWPIWVHKYLLKNEVFWDARDSVTGSWVWRKLLKLRPVANFFLKLAIKNGESVKFWLDIWHPMGHLIDVSGEIGTQKLGICRNARVCDVVVGTEWRFRSTRDRTLQAIVSQVRSFPVTITPDEEDELMWKHGQDDIRDSFSSNKTWSLICDPIENVAWHRVIWFQQGVPRFVFFAWLAIKDRLSKGGRMCNWELTQPCLFCGEPVETRDHLYFACPYTYSLDRSCW